MHTYTHARTHTHAGTHAHISIYLSVCLSIYLYTHTYIYLSIYLYLYLYLQRHVSISTSIYRLGQRRQGLARGACRAHGLEVLEHVPEDWVALVAPVGEVSGREAGLDGARDERLALHLPIRIL